MFTGIVESMGTITALDRVSIEVVSSLGPMAMGESVAVNGVCLTVVSQNIEKLRADLSQETLARTNLGRSTVGERVNLERPISADGRFGGHFVQGHVDAVGTVSGRRYFEDSIEMTFEASPGILRYIVDKGSIAVDGVSLTATRPDSKGFSVWLVPQTLRSTNLGRKNPGDPVNLEVDLIAKYVESLMRKPE